jgi:hypothetical protein
MSQDGSRSRRSTKNRGEPASHLAAGQQAQTWICARNYPQFSPLIATEWPLVHPLKKSQRHSGHTGHADLCEAAASGFQPALLPWRVQVGLVLVGWGSQLPLARARKDSLKSASHSDPPQFFFPPPKYLSPPVGADLFSLDFSILSLSSFILNLPSILSSCSRERPSQPLPCLLSNPRRSWACR